MLKQIHGVQGAVVSADRLGNATQATLDLSGVGAAPVVASIYQLDGLVRRASSLQLTADARQAVTAEGATA